MAATSAESGRQSRRPWTFGQQGETGMDGDLDQVVE